MPLRLTLDAPPAGYAMHHASGITGAPVLIAVREFVSSEDGELFLSRLEGMPSELLSKIPRSAGILPSIVDHLVAIIEQNLQVTLYVNECQVQVRARVARKIEAGEVVFENDVLDIDSLEFVGVNFPPDAAVICIFSAGWRKGMFYDFTPLGPGAPNREYDIQKLLGSYMAYLKSQQLFKLDEAAWKHLIDSLWFPFASLAKPLRGKVIAFAKDRQDLERLLPDLERSLRESLPRMLERWAESKVFEPHMEFIRHAAQEFDEGDTLSCTAILYPRIEGILRTIHEGTGLKAKATQKVLTETAIAAGGEALHNFSWLLPDMFRRYLDEAYFANFEPGQPAKLSRNSVGHGVANAAEFNLKGACLGFFVVDQLFFFAPRSAS